MPAPTLAMDIGPGYAWSATPSWTDITADLKPELTLSRGREYLAPAPRPGSMRFTLKNMSRDYDPEYAAGPYYGDLKPMMHVRLRATHNAVTYPLFRGFIMEWPNTILDHSYPIVEVEAWDGLTILERRKLRSVFEQQLRDLAPTTWYRFSEAAGDTLLIDSTAARSHGAVSGVTFGQTGPIVGGDDRAGLFDGVDDHVVLPSDTAIVGTGAFSIAALFRFDGSGSGTWVLYSQRSPLESLKAILIDVKHVFSVPRSIRVFVQGSNASTNVTVFSDVAVDDSEAHLLVYTQDASGNGELYFDGVSHDTDSDANWGLGDKPPVIGRDQSDSTGYWDGLVSELAIWDGTELTADQVADLHAAWSAPWSGQLTSERITAVLDQVGWPAGLRDLEVGLSSMSEFTEAGNSALSAINRAVETENGQLWVTADGTLTFRNRHSRSESTPVTTYSDDGSDIKHFEVSHVVDELNLFPVAQVRDASGRLTEASDSAAEDLYGPLTITRTSHSPDLAEHADYADWLASQHSTPRTRIRTLKARCFPTSSNARWAALLGRDSGDLVNVELTPPGGGAAIDLDVFIDKLDLRIGAGIWDAAYQASNADGQRTFKLDDPVLAELDGPHEGGLGW